ncbi:Imidazolonepropionase [hydrothermal vent metagenome]|uniref:imidazolonepropionase n=1 Tax=hydrothermal vent metagenome TaxID=652676 RepID=A0A3B1CWL7_9ZZZZ
MTIHFDLAITHCGEVLTLSGASKHPKRGRTLSELSLIQKGVVGISKGKIAWIGTQKSYQQTCSAKKEINAGGAVVMPAFVDPHTHTVFSGSRESEWFQKLSGRPYLEILKTGGGILKTVQQTRAASPQKLFKGAQKVLNQMAAHGTTTLEIKSGYGLNLKEETKILNVIGRLKKESPLDIVPTYLGAHVFPKLGQSNRKAYLAEAIETLTQIKNKAVFCDVFCEENAFSLSETRQILEAAKKLGFQLKLHAGQFSDLGGVALAITLQATSVDHLDVIKKRDITKLAASNTIGILLPGVSHFLNANKHAPARALIDQGVAVALATDFNPGSSPCFSMQHIIHLAVLNLKMTPAEAISAATINAAHAIGLSEKTGSIEVGKQADLIILNIEHYEQLPYFFGVNHVRTVIKKGKVLL